MSRVDQVLAYQDNAGSYDPDNGLRQRTMAKKADLVAALLTRTRQTFRQSVLEVGCGTGLFTERLAELLPHAFITATDAFPAMIEQAGRRLASFPNLRLLQYDAEAPLAANDAFDVICGCDIIHHLDDPVAAMRQWLKAVRPNGRLAFFESNAWNLPIYLRTFRRPEEARFKYSTRRNLLRWLREAGWQASEVSFAPIYLPNGPPSAWNAIGAAETAMHGIPPLRLFAGGLLLTAQAP